MFLSCGKLAEGEACSNLSKGVSITWYAIWVTTGYEHKVAALCERLISKDLYEECFIPRIQQRKKYLGQWHTIENPMFPGYIFIITDFITEIFYALKNIPEFTIILGDLQEPISLYESEVNMLSSMKNKDSVIEISKGYMVNDKIIITEGPLQNYKGCIKKIDRHKRMAIIEIDMFGRTTEVKLGLEIVSKQ